VNGLPLRMIEPAGNGSRRAFDREVNKEAPFLFLKRILREVGLRGASFLFYTLRTPSVRAILVLQAHA